MPRKQVIMVVAIFVLPSVEDRRQRIWLAGLGNVMKGSPLAVAGQGRIGSPANMTRPVVLEDVVEGAAGRVIHKAHRGLTIAIAMHSLETLHIPRRPGILAVLRYQDAGFSYSVIPCLGFAHVTCHLIQLVVVDYFTKEILYLAQLFPLPISFYFCNVSLPGFLHVGKQL